NAAESRDDYLSC
ncbi:ABC transporter of peptides domain protein, partial [Chlamydia psittaci 84-8471/1]